MSAGSRAMVLTAPGAPLTMIERDVPVPGAHEVRVRVDACGVCRTDLHIVDGELPAAAAAAGARPRDRRARRSARRRRRRDLPLGERVGVPWLGATCGALPYCASGRENLCDAPRFTGYTSTAATPSTPSPTRDYCFRLPAGLRRRCMPRRCCARA